MNQPSNPCKANCATVSPMAVPISIAEKYLANASVFVLSARFLGNFVRRVPSPSSYRKKSRTISANTYEMTNETRYTQTVSDHVDITKRMPQTKSVDKTGTAFPRKGRFRLNADNPSMSSTGIHSRCIESSREPNPAPSFCAPLQAFSSSRRLSRCSISSSYPSLRLGGYLALLGGERARLGECLSNPITTLLDANRAIRKWETPLRQNSWRRGL